MSFNAWPDNEVQDGKFVGRDVLVPRPACLEPLVPTAASECSAESLSRALSAAISSHAGAQRQYNIATPPSTVPYGARTPPQTSMPGQHAAEDPLISSGSLPPPSGGHSRQHSHAFSLSELRRRELETGHAIKLRQLAQLRVAAAEAEVAEFQAQMAEDLACSASSIAHSSRLHAGTRDTQAEEQRLPIQDSSQDRPTIAPSLNSSR